MPMQSGRMDAFYMQNLSSLNYTDENQLEQLLLLDDFTKLFRYADLVRANHHGDIVHIRALLEFSNYCKRRCSYCGLSSQNTNIYRFRMTPDEIVSTALEAAAIGYRTIVLQSGEDEWFTPRILGDIVKKIKPSGMEITLSCGELSYDVYAYLKECGADKYLLKHETADPDIYAALHPGASLENRITCLRHLKCLGYKTGSGFMIGLPSQTAATIARDLILLKSIPCDMAGIGPFIPHPDTPLKDNPSGSIELTQRAVALARILLPNAHLPATTALGVLDKSMKDRIFSCGANVVMQKITPQCYRDDYTIYPASIKDLGIKAGRIAIEDDVRSIARTPL